MYATAARGVAALPKIISGLGQGARMAGQAAVANPQLAALLGAGVIAPPVLGYTHGRVAGFNDPSKGGVGGSLGYTLLGSPIAGAAYGLGHEAGRGRANPVSKAAPTLGGITEKELEEYLMKRDMMQQTIQNAASALRPRPY